MTSRLGLLAVMGLWVLAGERLQVPIPRAFNFQTWGKQRKKLRLENKSYLSLLCHWL